MSRTAPHLLRLALGLGAVAVSALAAPAHADPVTIERVVAVVNDEVILLTELNDKALQLSGQRLDDSTPDGHKKLRQVLDRMVDDTLALQQASTLKLSVDDPEIDRAIDEVKNSNHLDNDGLKAALAEQGYTYASFRKDMRRQILRLKVVNTAVRSRINITDEEVRAFYEQNARQAGGGNRQAHIRHIQLGVPPGASDKDIDARRKAAMKIVEEARGGDFAALAKKYSDDAGTKDDGGDLGWIKESDGLLPAAMSEVVFSMDQPNEVRGPVRTDRGFEVVQLVERKDGDVRPLSEVREQIRNQLYQQQMEKQTQSWISELRKKAHLEVRY